MTDRTSGELPVRVVARCLGPLGPIRSILVLKLDHLGDFLIGEPALASLRASFPDARIRLLVGPWNLARAEASGLADEVRSYAYFPRNAREWDGQPEQPLAEFRHEASGRFDLAVDLRVDEDTRFLLQHVDARWRAGIGTRAHQEYLDILLPAEHADRTAPAAQPEPLQTLAGASLGGRLRLDRHGLRSGWLAHQVAEPLIETPPIRLDPGIYRVHFDCLVRGLGFGLRHASMVFSAWGGSELIAERSYPGRACSQIAAEPPMIEFAAIDPEGIYRCTVRLVGAPFIGRIAQGAVRIEVMRGGRGARLLPVELHTGETLSLLVALIRERTRAIYHFPPEPVAGPPRIVIAPCSNSSLRDWPPAFYTALLQLLLLKTDATLVLIGAPDQAEDIERILAPLGDQPRVENRVGILPWSDLPDLLRGAHLVLCNNSGIAHLAANFGARLLALYSASHQVQQWGPRGPTARVLVAEIGCGPCGFDTLSQCPNDHACMRAITPGIVLDEILAMLDTAPDRAG